MDSLAKFVASLWFSITLMSSGVMAGQELPDHWQKRGIDWAAGETPFRAIFRPLSTSEVRGPQLAKGAIIYIPPVDTMSKEAPNWQFDPSQERIPPYLLTLNRDGWDIFGVTFTDKSEIEKTKTSVAGWIGALTVREFANELKSKGYESPVVAGSSAGAWFGLLATLFDDHLIEAVVAAAPAIYGERGSIDFEGNAIALYAILPYIHDARIFMVFFRDDSYDPAPRERGRVSRKLLTEAKIPHFIVDRPQNLRGHDADWTDQFATRFGSCIRDFLSADELEGFKCK